MQILFFNLETHEIKGTLWGKPIQYVRPSAGPEEAEPGPYLEFCLCPLLVNRVKTILTL